MEYIDVSCNEAYALDSQGKLWYRNSRYTKWVDMRVYLHHVTTDCYGRAWGVNFDGVIKYYDGTKWAFKPNPENVKIASVHGERNNVWALDTDNVLWY